MSGSEVYGMLKFEAVERRSAVMAQYFRIHPENPQHRLIKHAAGIINAGGVAALPTDSCYILACHIGDKSAMEKLRRIRGLGAKHPFTLMCRDLSELSLYAKVSNRDYRILKANTPGAYTFILPATSEVPNRLKNPKRKTIGIRVVDSAIVQALLAILDQPIIGTTLILADQQLPLSDPMDIRIFLESKVDLIIDGGSCGFEPTTVVNLVGSPPAIIRLGKGSAESLGIDPLPV